MRGGRAGAAAAALLPRRGLRQHRQQDADLFRGNASPAAGLQEYRQCRPTLVSTVFNFEYLLSKIQKNTGSFYTSCLIFINLRTITNQAEAI